MAATSTSACKYVQFPSTTFSVHCFLIFPGLRKTRHVPSPISRMVMFLTPVGKVQSASHNPQPWSHTYTHRTHTHKRFESVLIRQLKKGTEVPRWVDTQENHKSGYDSDSPSLSVRCVCIRALWAHEVHLLGNRNHGGPSES